MAAGRSFKSLMGRRRRAEEEGEDEEGPVVVEDSLSEGSVLSDGEEDDADASSVGVLSAAEAGADPEQPVVKAAADEGRTAGKKVRKARKKVATKKQDQDLASEGPSQPQAVNFKAMADTEAMMNGLKMESAASQEVLDFENVDRSVSATAPMGGQAETPSAPINGQAAPSMDRQRREHEEYKKKRDADPAFIPNRGNFFMHDTRGQNGGGQPLRGGYNGRGRGARGGANIGGPFSPANHMAQAEKAAEQPWKHDLHDTINEEPSTLSKPMDSPQDRDDSARLFPKAQSGHHQNQQAQRPLSFSSTTLVGKVQIRVFLPGMKAPILFSEVPWKQYTRLPDHRPPLRRDKPVRISLPGHTQRYIFPAPDRSFIFIPRQMRPNQQGFGRNAYQRSVGGYGYSSRRTSMYGGSMYAASVAASRRSSFASVARESAFSPVGSYVGGMPPTRPVVRLPHGSQTHFSGPSTPMGPLSGHQTPTGFQVHTFPLPQQPFAQGTPTTTVHQPRPQKAISVTGIESPAMLGHAPHSSESQPFQNQLPQHMVEQPAYGQPQGAFFSPRQQYMYPPQPATGTPLSGIPEQAVHAQSFQPPMMPYGGQPYYPPYSQQQGYYGYPQGPGPGSYQPMPMYPPPPQNYMMSPAGPPMPPPPQPPSQPLEQDQSQSQAQPQSGMVAHESNGMVFYMPASEAREQSQGESYQPAESFVPSYAMPGLPPPTPAPEHAYSYPSQMPMQLMPQYYGPAGQQ